MSTVALIPARNELEIRLAVDGIRRQTLPVDLLLVIINNDTSDGKTARIAREHGAEVIDVGTITGKKAGALNIGLALVLEKYPETEYILQADADTVLEEHFIERTIAAMSANPRIGGLCACFQGRRKPGANLFASFLISSQRQEYARFNGNQLSTQASVLSGTASLLRVEALVQLKAERGFVWSETCLAEDYETTKALQSRGWLCMTDKSFISYTDVMTTWGDLIQQRKRWQRGTLDVVFRLYKGQRCVRRDARAQLVSYIAYPLQMASYAFLAISSIWWPIYIVPLIATFLLFSLYGALSVRIAGWRAMLMAAAFIPGEVYNLLRYYWLVRSWWLYRKQTLQSW
jgi:cellulose synthase/poly-beta-1,6-N-acetylglucosamine synthase-like glycosyltransferase